MIIDEISDASNKYQVAIVFRYVTKGKPVERLWDFLIPPNHDTKTLSSLILVELEKHLENNIGKLIAQTYDGMTVMSGSCKKVQTLIKKTYKHAAYIHCYTQQLNLAVLNAASAITNVRIFFANLQGICTFLSSSPQRIAIPDEVVKMRLPRSPPTKWDFNSKIVETVFEHREDIIEPMQMILKESKNASIATINQASGYIAILTRQNFIFWLDLFYRVMPYVEELFAKFQTKEIDSIIVNICIL